MAALKKLGLERCLFAAAQLAAWVGTVLGLSHSGGAVSGTTLAAMSVGYVACVVAFVLGRSPGIAGLGIFAVLGVAAHLETSLYGGQSGVHHGKLMPAGATLAWSVAWLASRRSSIDARKALAREAMAGACAACYVLAGIAKLRSGGLDWARNVNLPLLVAERAVGATGPLAALRDGFARHASSGASSALSGMALVLELGAVALLFPRARRAYALALVGMHAGIGVLLGYHYIDWILLLLALALAPRPRFARAAASV